MRIAQNSRRTEGVKNKKANKRKTKLEDGEKYRKICNKKSMILGNGRKTLDVRCFCSHQSSIRDKSLLEEL
ncbi:Uncharacterized protein APZ42_022590 [Daphnia magna]|uniref:Uncharacterized protein n=1 Tax=Daphnia magna TaxID=35525 RepID=A0A0P5Z641_9CRUS|nr:Uncharacterized protein APZ42_022590 [Daphnia magna]